MAEDLSARRASFSLTSLLALICGILAFSNDTAGWSMIAAIGAMVLGALGVLLALLPKVRGGLISILSILMGVVGFFLAVLRLAF